MTRKYFISNADNTSASQWHTGGTISWDDIEWKHQTVEIKVEPAHRGKLRADWEQGTVLASGRISNANLPLDIRLYSFEDGTYKWAVVGKRSWSSRDTDYYWGKDFSSEAGPDDAVAELENAIGTFVNWREATKAYTEICLGLSDKFTVQVGDSDFVGNRVNVKDTRSAVDEHYLYNYVKTPNEIRKYSADTTLAFDTKAEEISQAFSRHTQKKGQM